MLKNVSESIRQRRDRLEPPGASAPSRICHGSGKFGLSHRGSKKQYPRRLNRPETSLLRIISVPEKDDQHRRPRRNHHLRPHRRCQNFKQIHENRVPQLQVLPRHSFAPKPPHQPPREQDATVHAKIRPQALRGWPPRGRV